ncbi:hypothetical protein [Wenjunlia tyrosinilytica]|nr:hypothetical protein [Wenjunlia tyrosinilytica]
MRIPLRAMMPRPPDHAARPAAARAVCALSLAGALALLAGCGAPGRLRGDGPTPAASSPIQLWTDEAPSPPSPSPPDTYEDAFRVPGLPEVASNDIRDVNTIDVVRKDATTMNKATDLDEALLPLVTSGCAHGCRFRTPAYQDITGDGELDLIIATDFKEDHYASVHAYALRKGKVFRILASGACFAAVEVSDKRLTIRAPDPFTGLLDSTIYGWDGWKHGMVYQANLTARITRVRGSLSPTALPRKSTGPPVFRPAEVRSASPNQSDGVPR